MRRNISKVSLLIAIAAFALLATAQTTRGRITFSTESHSTHARSPYTAEYKVTRVQTLANGNTITHEDKEVRAVDSQGRELTEWITPRASKEQETTSNYTVLDPVAHTITHWSSQLTRVTVRSTHGPSTPVCPSDRMPMHAVHSNTSGQHTVEQLGTDSIQGIQVRGTRTTSTIPAGEMGNDAPLVTTSETWSAIDPALNHLTVRQISDDPRYGKSSRELTSFTAGDPDPSVFQPPANYEIVTEEDVVTKTSDSPCPAVEAPKE